MRPEDKKFGTKSSAFDGMPLVEQLIARAKEIDGAAGWEAPLEEMAPELSGLAAKLARIVEVLIGPVKCATRARLDASDARRAEQTMARINQIAEEK